MKSKLMMAIETRLKLRNEIRRTPEEDKFMMEETHEIVKSKRDSVRLMEL